MDRKAEQIQIHVWIITAMISLLALRAPEDGVLTNLIFGTALTCVCVCVNKLCAGVAWSAWMRAVQWIWSFVMLLYFLKDAAAIWGAQGKIIPVCLVLISLWSAGKGVSKASAVGATLIWFVVLLIGGIVAGAAEDVKWRWMIKDAADFSPGLIPVYLLPAIAWMFGAKGSVKSSVLIPLIGTVLSAVVRGIVPVLPGDKPGIVELSRSVEVFGRVLRLEAVAAMGLTLGLYCGISLLTSVLAERSFKKDKKEKSPALWVTGIALVAGLLGNITISDEIAAVGCVICWVFLPIITQAVGRRKKS